MTDFNTIVEIDIDSGELVSRIDVIVKHRLVHCGVFDELTALDQKPISLLLTLDDSFSSII
jgi:hypothetical protein